MTDNLIRVRFPLEQGLWHGHDAEWMWAEPLSSNAAIVRNIPAYAFDISFYDTINTTQEDGVSLFNSVQARGGHSTYRLIVPTGTPDERFHREWQRLERLGCTYESSSEGRLYAVDVPHDCDISQVYKILEDGERAGVWGFEEGHCGHVV